MSQQHHSRVLILGSGPAGLTAAIYAARAALEPMLVHGIQPGGQMTITTDVENYPGFAEVVQGPWLMEEMQKQAEAVGTRMVGDTITEDKRRAAEPLAGFRPSVPVVFCGLFPVDANDYEDLRTALDKLHLNDASFHFEPETSAGLGFGFRCGFLGLLHLEIIQERLEREFDLDLIATSPSVVYRIHKTDGSTVELHNPVDMPETMQIASMEEPWIKATILVPDEYLGAILQLCTERRGEQIELTYAGSRAMVVYRLPLNEVVFDFYDRLKLGIIEKYI